jgi:hypothetical protein
MFLNRILGVFKLSVATFEEIEHDPNATGQAAILVGITAVLAAFGSGFSAAFAGNSFFGSFIGTLIWTFIGWFLWALVSYLIGTGLFNGQATLDEMLRVIGFAYAPQMLAIIPLCGSLIGFIWSLLAGFIAIRQGLDLDDIRAFLTILVGFAVYAVGYLILAAFLGSFGLFFR